jgi:phage shock protein PspC (stress-responsive transcriptional regulator)
MSEQSTDQSTGMDKFYAALRGFGIRRRTDDKWVAGVCSGLADRLGIDPVIVRAGLVLLSLLWGFGLTVYLVAWALLPNDKDEIVVQRALAGHFASIMVVVLAALALFGGSSWGHSGWGFPWGLALTGLLVWWLVKRSGQRPDADQRVSSYQSGTGTTFAKGTTPATSGSAPTTVLPPVPMAGTSRPASPTSRPAVPVVPPKPRRRSGGPLMALLALGLALATYGSLSWAGNSFGWTGDHQSIAMAGSLAALGALLVGLGLAGWRAGFVGFLTIVMAIATLLSTVVPSGIDVGGRVGDVTWSPTSVTAGANRDTYRVGAGTGVLDLSKLSSQALRPTTPAPTLPAYVGVGDLTVLVPPGLNVRVDGHVGLGEILLPGETEGSGGHDGSDVSRSTVIGTGPTDVIVDAGVGIGSLTVVKE